MRVLGLDPGLRHTGWGIIDVAGNHLTYVADGVAHAATEEPLAARLVALFRQITAIVVSVGPAQLTCTWSVVGVAPKTSLLIAAEMLVGERTS